MTSDTLADRLAEIFNALPVNDDGAVPWALMANAIDEARRLALESTPPKVGSGELDAAGLAHIADLEAFQTEVWGWLRKRGLVDDNQDEWDGFTTVIEEHEAEIEEAASRAALASPVDHPEVVGETMAEVEARVMQEYRWGNLTSLGVANHLRRGGFRIEIAQAKANALRPSDSPALEAGVAEAATNLVNFAWSAVVADCDASAEYLNGLVIKLRGALAAREASR